MSDREVVESIVASGLGVREWCESSGVPRSRAYKVLNAFRICEPSVFGAGEAEARASDGTGPWYERVRGSLPPTRPAAAAEAGDFAVVEVAPAPAGRAPIVVEVGPVRVVLPAGSSASDAAAAVSAVVGSLGVTAR